LDTFFTDEKLIMGMVNSHKINLSETLDELLSETDMTSVQIAEELDISPTSLTHYRQGESKPRLDTVVDLAAILDVSLDYLILGKSHEAREVDTDPVLQYMDQSLHDAQTQTSQYASLVTRIGQRLSDRVDEEVKNHLSENSSDHQFPGMVTRDELMTLEKHSHVTRLLVRSLRYNITEATSETPGMFFTTVANNLCRGREYQYLLPKQVGKNWKSVVNDLRRALVNQIGSERAVRTNCHFRVTDHPVAAGYGLYQLVERDLQEDNAILYDFLDEHEYITRRGGFGYIITPSSDVQGDVIMDEIHQSGAAASFEELWRKADPV
jgi:transcriptional regulator with XRE-family HTH domain